MLEFLEDNRFYMFTLSAYLFNKTKVGNSQRVPVLDKKLVTPKVLNNHSHKNQVYYCQMHLHRI